jgi:hypothetical protein
MTAQEFAAKLEALIAEARATGVPDDENSHLAPGRH